MRPCDVATVPFEITQFQQLDLEGPRKQMRGDSPMNSKGISNNKEEAKPVPKWAVKTVEFEIDVSPLR